MCTRLARIHDERHDIILLCDFCSTRLRRYAFRKTVWPGPSRWRPLPPESCGFAPATTASWPTDRTPVHTQWIVDARIDMSREQRRRQQRPVLRVAEEWLQLFPWCRNTFQLPRACAFHSGRGVHTDRSKRVVLCRGCTAICTSK